MKINASKTAEKVANFVHVHSDQTAAVLVCIVFPNLSVQVNRILTLF